MEEKRLELEEKESSLFYETWGFAPSQSRDRDLILFMVRATSVKRGLSISPDLGVDAGGGPAQGGPLGPGQGSIGGNGPAGCGGQGEDLYTLEAEITELQRENARVESQVMRLRSDIASMENQLKHGDKVRYYAQPVFRLFSSCTFLPRHDIPLSLFAVIYVCWKFQNSIIYRW